MFIIKNQDIKKINLKDININTKKSSNILYFSIYQKIKPKCKFTITEYLFIFYNSRYNYLLVFQLRLITYELFLF